MWRAARRDWPTPSDRVRIEWRRRRHERPVADDEHDQRAAEDCESGGQQHQLTPVGPEERRQQVRDRLAEGQGANQQAEREAAAVAKPAGRNLHRRRIDERQ